MGFYLNSKKPVDLYQSETVSTYFVDKTEILTELIPLVEQRKKYLCITRPRRFGKTVMANMIAAFFGKYDSGDLFDQLKIASKKGFSEHKNQHNVIYISLKEMPKIKTFEAYLDRIERKLRQDLKKAYPESTLSEEDPLWDVLNTIYNDCEDGKFIFVLDEWDFVFHRDFLTEEDKRSYLSFLSDLLKDQPYVELAYMTGIMPIAKYSSGSELNMFQEYTMASRERFGGYFGFSEEEVDVLYEHYLANTPLPGVTREGLRDWYDGYDALIKVEDKDDREQSPRVSTFNGTELKGVKYTVRKLYNPCFVVCSLTDNQFTDYWTGSRSDAESDKDRGHLVLPGGHRQSA